MFDFLLAAPLGVIGVLLLIGAVAEPVTASAVETADRWIAIIAGLLLIMASLRIGALAFA